MPALGASLSLTGVNLNFGCAVAALDPVCGAASRRSPALGTRLILSAIHLEFMTAITCYPHDVCLLSMVELNCSKEA